MGEDEQPRQPQRPALSSDEALDRLLRRLGPLLRWQDHEETAAPEDGDLQPDPAFAHRLRTRLTEGDASTGATAARRGLWSVGGGLALRVGLAAAALAVVILVAVAVVEVGVIAALTTALALVVLAVVLVVRARLGQ